ncbi:metallophosphoesterase [Salipiger abyssi]|uniref:metallophosphoesterase n=1 Tax=Salipiger abyssi TaxID=1250539 RepID=UPI001A8C1D4D|nr:metallophosphoesterase [Salipiger abyssi]MBN9886657.1 metallophosphoesterase [Salipiger abyssi]
MTHWYTADLHLGHENIIPFSGRPFRHAGHMDAVLIANLWEKVGHDDDLWIIGDFAFGPKAKDEDWLTMIFGQLPGARRHLVVGNHDGPLTQSLPWDSVDLMCEVEDPAASLPITLCHYPMMTWHHARKGALHLFGHVHHGWPGSSNSVNVGVDVWDFFPVTAQEAVHRARKMSAHKHWADVEPRVR